MRSMRPANSMQSLASLLVEPDEYIILTQMKHILDSTPARRPPLEPTQLLPHLLMGSQRNAGDIYTLQELGVTHVLNCAGLKASAAQKNPYPRDSGIKNYLCIPAEDQPNYDIAQHFEDALKFVDTAKETGGRILIHCNLGINRSGAICAACMVCDQFMPLLDVVTLMKQARGLVLCNKGFRRQLIKFVKMRNLPITAVPDSGSVLLHGLSKPIPPDTVSLPGVLREEDGWVTPTGTLCPESGTKDLHHLKPQRFATAYCTLPRKSGLGRFTSKKRQVTASHYDQEYFMDAIPEDRPAHKFLPNRPGLVPPPEPEPENRGMSAFGSLSFAAFRKFKSKSVQSEFADPSPPRFSSLSTTRPLKIYRRSITDSEVCTKPPPQLFYKRADTVATCEATAGLQALSISTQPSVKEIGGEHGQDKNTPAPQKPKNNFFRRFRTEKK